MAIAIATATSAAVYFLWTAKAIATATDAAMYF